MSAISNQSFEIAREESCRLWAYCGAQYVNDDFLLKEVAHQVLRSLSIFSLNARRVLESLPKDKKYLLDSSPWSRASSIPGLETDLWGSLALVIHARDLRVAFGTLAEAAYAPDAKIITHALVSTDNKADRAIEPFAMAYAFLEQIAPIYGEGA